MTNKKSTKRALTSSILSLALCMTMLIGTTFAWFTDSATSANNKIQAGKLDVELYLYDGAEYKNISESSQAIFGPAGLAQNENAATLWEPGKTQVAYLSIKNEGNLDLKYKVAIDVINPEDGKNLYEVMEYAITPDAKAGEVTAWNGGTGVVPGINYTKDYNDIALKANEEHFFALSVHMLEEAGNQYQEGKVEFDIKVLAGQLASEEDSFNNQYDKLAAYAGLGYAPAPTGNQTATEVIVKDDDSVTVGSLVFPAASIADDAETVKVIIDKSTYKANIKVEDDQETRAYEITVEGLKEGNTTPVKVTLNMPQNLNPNTVAVYHYNTKIDSTYDPYTGYLIFESTSFSPFTVVYDVEDKYVPPVVGEDGVQFPAQKDIVSEFDINKTPGYAGCDETWGSYGQWSPTENMPAQMEAAYKFVCPEDGDETYMNWYCDFYVKLDKDLKADQIFLGGNYGSWGWVGFHNGEFTLEAGKELGILESVTTNPWTYAQVKAQVGEFICGVGDVNNTLSGATFTVMLRLTNPETGVSYDVATVTHTFN